MTLTWSWEEMDYIDDGEPRLLPDLWIEPGATCSYCGKTEEESGKRLAVQCSQCGGVAHFLCAEDCRPDPYAHDEEYNDFVCGTCLNWTPDQAREHAEKHAAPVLVAATASSAPAGGDDFDPFLDSDELP